MPRTLPLLPSAQYFQDMSWGFCFSFHKYSPSKRPLALPRSEEQAVLGPGRRGSWIIFKLYSTRWTERDLGLLLGIWKEK